MEGGANEARKETTRHCQSLSVSISLSHQLSQEQM